MTQGSLSRDDGEIPGYVKEERQSISVLCRSHAFELIFPCSDLRGLSLGICYYLHRARYELFNDLLCAPAAGAETPRGKI